MQAAFLQLPISELAEGPCWDEENERLLWVDIIGKKIHIYDSNKHFKQSIELNQYVGAVALRQGGGLVAAMHHGFYTIDIKDGTASLLSDPEGDLPDNRFNDGKCDPAGRFWAGTMSLQDKEKTGALYRLDPNGSVHKMLVDISISNGLAWSPDGSTMYYIDTPTFGVFAFDYDLSTGEIENRRKVIDVPKNEGYPDGMSIDEEGMLWIAHWGGWQVARWNPKTGIKLSSVSLPVARVTSCIFGGQNLDELYITTARVGLSKQELKEQPMAGGIFAVKTTVKGTPMYTFRG